MIEERELSFTREEPLLAWRLFRVRRTVEGYVLCSPMIHSPAPPPWEPGLVLAVCFERDHAAPAPGCRCGIYGAVEGTLDSLPGYLLDTRSDGDPWAYAEIACSGRVFLDARGVRCEEALLVRIALAEESFPAVVERERAREGLTARYSVATQPSDTVPAWLINNARKQGPPLDGEDIDLAALTETLMSNGRRWPARKKRSARPRSTLDRSHAAEGRKSVSAERDEFAVENHTCGRGQAPERDPSRRRKRQSSRGDSSA